jgi:hypothetical protein
MTAAAWAGFRVSKAERVDVMLMHGAVWMNSIGDRG